MLQKILQYAVLRLSRVRTKQTIFYRNNKKINRVVSKKMYKKIEQNSIVLSREYFKNS